jgi:hypothetical protein
VQDHNGERFYAEYKEVVIPIILGQWHFTRPYLLAKEYATSLEEAEKRIDDFLAKDKHRWASNIELKARKKVEEIIEYP